MKRLFALLLLSVLLLQTTACIHLEPLSPADTTTREPAESESREPPLVLPSPPPLPAWTDAETTAASFFGDTAHATVDVTEAEYSYEEMCQDLARLQKTYPAHFSYESFGKSVAGRELYVCVLGNPNAARQVLVSAGIHGREYLTPLLVMKQLEFYLHYYDTGSCNGIPYARLFDNCAFYIVPMTNPDGIMLSQEGLSSVSDPALRKIVQSVYEADFQKGYTSQTDIDEYLKYWKANIRGVDLNRNFDALWENYRAGEKVPCHKNYKGETPVSEPETQAMVALTERSHRIAAVLCIHSQGEVLYWNCGQNEALLADTRDFTVTLSGRTGYKVIAEQNNDASYSDWCALEKNLIAVTVETGLGLCPLFIDKLPAMWEDNFDLLPLTAYYFTVAQAES